MSLGFGMLDLYARHAVPAITSRERASNQRAEAERSGGVVPSVPRPNSPLAPPYMIYPAQVVAACEDRAA